MIKRGDIGVIKTINKKNRKTEKQKNRKIVKIE